MRVAFVFPNPRTDLVEQVARGEAPDTLLYGQNHMAELGFESFVYDSVLRRRHRPGGAMHRLTWHARELALPFELRGADVVVTPLATMLPLVARARRGPKVITVSYHLCTQHARASTPTKQLIAASTRSAAAVVCASRAGRACVIARTHANPDVVDTVTLGVDARYWQDLGAPPPDGYVLTVGRDLARDYTTFVEAVKGLDIPVILVAKEENIRGITLPPNVTVRMGASPAELRELYAGASCLVVPIVDERRRLGTENSGCTAILEGMASRRPVVVTRRSFLAEYVRHDDTGLLVQPEDAAELRAAIERVLSDRELASSLATAARRDVEARQTTHHYAQGLARVIEAVT